MLKLCMYKEKYSGLEIMDLNFLLHMIVYV